jgi:glycosyltransferase involved in cell wall biosynthesis
MKLSVIIPCLNAAGSIDIQLKALAKQRSREPWEVIVSDNGSNDESLTIIERYRERLPELRIVDSSERRGAGHARNVGALAATGEVLAYCDADDEVAPGWVAAMGEALARHDFVACRVDFARLNESWLQDLFQDHPQISQLQKLSYPPYFQHAGGGTLGVKKLVHEAVGGFDESLLAHEDTDCCLRIQQTGTELHFARDPVIHIRCRRTLSGLFQLARIWAEYNVLLYKKCRPLEREDLWRWKSFLRQWQHLLYCLPGIRSKAGRALWVWNLGWRVGALMGSLKYHVPPVLFG